MTAVHDHDNRLIPISALQHFSFCPRQCAYIHIEQRWQDNHLTAQGNQLHERVHSHEAESRKDIRSERGSSVVSHQLGIQGKLDLLEISQNPLIFTPVEYKRGRPKTKDCDRIQLCAQALCLEEMCETNIERAALWYWQVRQREWVDLNAELREKTIDTIMAVTALFRQNALPKARYSSACKACSFFDICAPKQADHSAEYVTAMFST